MSSILVDMISDGDIELDQQIVELKNLKNYIVKHVQETIKDLDIDLATRWNLFCQAQEFLPHDSSYMSFDVLNDAGLDSWYDYFNTERYALVNLLDVVDTVIVHQNDKYYLSRDDNHVWLSVDVDALKEEILACGYASFEYDW